MLGIWEGRLRKLMVQGLVVAGCCLLVGRISGQSPDTSYRPRAGDRAMLMRVDRNTGDLLDVTALQDGDAYLDLWTAAKAGDFEAITEMARQGRALRFKARTEVQVKKVERFPAKGDPRPPAALVHVLSDPKPDRVYWVATIYVGRLRAKP